MNKILTLITRTFFIFIGIVSIIYFNNKKTKNKMTDLNGKSFRLTDERDGKIILEWDYQKMKLLVQEKPSEEIYMLLSKLESNENLTS